MSDSDFISNVDNENFEEKTINLKIFIRQLQETKSYILSSQAPLFLQV